jgi:hypothetical protein
MQNGLLGKQTVSQDVTPRMGTQGAWGDNQGELPKARPFEFLAPGGWGAEYPEPVL